MSVEILEQPTLVLNRNWQPIHVTTVVRALRMLWNESARVVDPDEYRLYDWESWLTLRPSHDAPCIRTANSRLRVPEIICLTSYDRLPSKSLAFSRRNIARRDHYTCQYCGTQPGAELITVDHVVPRSQSGLTNWTNCVAACSGCNARKANRTPEQAGMHLRKRPGRPNWNPLDLVREARVDCWARFINDPMTANT